MLIDFRICALISLCLFLFSGSTALASDLAPPAWRGVAGATYQQWLFLFDSPVHNTDTPLVCAETTVNKTPWGQRAPPENIDNPYQQETGICAEFKSLWPIAQNIDWLKNYNNREGVWKLEKEQTFTNFLNFIVPNASARENAKTTIQVQTAFYSPGAGPLISIYTQSIGNPPVTTPLEQGKQPDDVRLPEGWSHHTAIFMVDNCPDIISVFITPPQHDELYIDSVTIDTFCSIDP